MNIGFTLKDTIQKIAVKFFPASLPTVEKPYILRAVHQTELDIHELAMKAAVYNIPVSPKVIEKGLNAGFELMYYLAANGYRIRTPLFNLTISIPGQYDGAETQLPEGVYPQPRFKANPGFRKYLKEKVKVEFAGVDCCEGCIDEAKDEATGLADTVITRGNILTINGRGLKVRWDETHKDMAGVFFLPETGEPVRAKEIAFNTPGRLIVQIPMELRVGESYRLAVGTQSTPRHGGKLLKDVRNIRSDFTLTAA